MSSSVPRMMYRRSVEALSPVVPSRLSHFSETVIMVKLERSDTD